MEKKFRGRKSIFLWLVCRVLLIGTRRSQVFVVRIFCAHTKCRSLLCAVVRNTTNPKDRRSTSRPSHVSVLLVIFSRVMGMRHTAKRLLCCVFDLGRMTKRIFAVCLYFIVCYLSCTQQRAGSSCTRGNAHNESSVHSEIGVYCSVDFS